MTKDDVLEAIEELNFTTNKMEVATKELQKANSSLSISGNIKDISSVLKIITYAMLSDENTKNSIIYFAKKIKDKDLLDFLERFEDVW